MDSDPEALVPISTVVSSDKSKTKHAPGLLLLVLLSSILTAHLLPLIASHSISVLLLVPPIHFALLAVVAALCGALSGGSTSRRKLTRAPDDDGTDEVRDVAMMAGPLAALAMACQLLEAGMVNKTVWQSLEAYMLPLLVLVPDLLPSPTVVAPYTIPAFLLSFTLLGSPVSLSGLLLLCLRIPVETLKLTLLKKGLVLSGGGSGQFMMWTVLTGLLTSLLPPIIFHLFLPSFPQFPIDYLPLLFYHGLLLLATCTTVVYLSKPTITPLHLGTLLFPRNLFLLFVDTGWRQGGGQTTLVLAAATFYFYNPFVPQTKAARAPSTENPFKSPLWPVITFLPLLFLLLQSLFPSPVLPPSNFPVLSTVSRSNSQLSLGTVDMVFSYYNEDLTDFKGHVERMKHRPFILWRIRTTRVVVYNKGPKSEKDIREGLGLRKGDEIFKLPNKGREGGTYLSHILRLYNSTALSLSPHSPPVRRHEVFADHTFFLQPHLAWAEISQPRLQLIQANTGFFHFGPLMKSTCGVDERGNGDYPVLREIYNIFRGELCPPTGQLSAWSAQFIVSKRRILQNPYRHYEAISALIHADESHWIQQTWGPNDSDRGDPANPAVGHALERSWPIIFGCGDPKMAEQCTDDVANASLCQCFD